MLFKFKTRNHGLKNNLQSCNSLRISYHGQIVSLHKDIFTIRNIEGWFLKFHKKKNLPFAFYSDFLLNENSTNNLDI